MDDPTWWRGFAQAAVLVGAVLVALGTFGSYYFGRREDDAKETKSKAREEQLAGRINTLTEGNKTILEKLAPFEELARRRFPEMATEEAMARLRAELSTVRELATRDVFRPLVSSVRQRLVLQLRGLRSQQLAPAEVALHVHNFAAPNVEPLVNELVEVLKEGEVPVRVATVTGQSIVMPKPPPYVMRSAPDSRELAAKLATALGAFLVSEPVLQAVQTIRPGVVEIILYGQPNFQSDGSVVLR